MKVLKSLFVIVCIFSSQIIAVELINKKNKNNNDSQALAKEWYNNYFKHLDQGSKHLLAEYIFYKYLQSSGSDNDIRTNNKYLSSNLAKYINNNWKVDSKTSIAFKKLRKFNGQPESLAYIYDNLVLNDIQFPYYTFIIPEIHEEQIYFSKKMQKLFE